MLHWTSVDPPICGPTLIEKRTIEQDISLLGGTRGRWRATLLKWTFPFALAVL